MGVSWVDEIWVSSVSFANGYDEPETRGTGERE